MIYTSPFPAIEAEPAALPELVCRMSERAPHQPAIVTADEGAVITYGMLADRIGQVAAALAGRGFSPGDVLGIRAPNSPAWAAVALGAMAAGGSVTGLSPLATGREVAGQLADAGAAMLVTAPALLAESREAAAAAGTRDVVDLCALLASTGIGTRTGTGERAGTGAQTGTGARTGGTAGAGDIALLPYSSGTTGLPKGVMLTHGNLTAAARQLGCGMALTAWDRFLGMAPFAHVMGFVVSLCTPLAAGATVVMPPRYELPALLAAIQRHRVTVVAVPPPVFGALARDPAVDDYDLSSVELIVSGGAPLGRELQQRVAERFGAAVVGQGYGLTETAATIPVPLRQGMVPGSVGRLGPGTELRLVDPGTGRDAGPGEPGELWARGPQVMAGYLGRPEATAEILDAEGWLRTGDLGRIDTDGNVFIVDRLKELIKVNAYQVAPAEIEALLAGHPRVADAAVIPRPDEQAGEVPVAVVVPRGAVEPEQLIAWVAERVSPYKRIRAVRLVSVIPRTPSGKILRRLLIEAGPSAGAAGAGGEPRLVRDKRKDL